MDFPVSHVGFQGCNFFLNFHVGILQVDSIPKLESQSADFFVFRGTDLRDLNLSHSRVRDSLIHRSFAVFF